ncbi:MAG: hypothetical protein J5I93_06300 [Pirellulaceae bacterium]|nr:hypothetical protein [Pirellulaceae bacterium]
MAVDAQAVFHAGGRGRIDLLEYVVRSEQLDALFLLLVAEFQLHPTTAKALALYELFCAWGAPARITLPRLLPPHDVRLTQALAPYVRDARKLDELRGQPADAERSEPPPSLMLAPPKFLFDSLATALLAGSDSPLDRLGHDYDPELTPLENLPGGKMSARQKFFVDFIWTPRIRPRLVAAGFRSIANVA